MNVECRREQDVLDARAARRWPERCEEELRAHVSACSVCADLVDVAGALLNDRDAVYDDARVPSSGIVWWRAQLQAREDAARAAGRPIAFIQGVAASAALWLILTVARATPSQTVATWKDWLLGLVPHVPLSVPKLAQVVAAVPLSVIVFVLVSLVFAPLAIYLAVSED